MAVPQGAASRGPYPCHTALGGSGFRRVATTATATLTTTTAATAAAATAAAAAAATPATGSAALATGSVHARSLPGGPAALFYLVRAAPCLRLGGFGRLAAASWWN